MRSISMVGLACLAILTGPVLADDTMPRGPHDGSVQVASAPTAPAAVPSWNPADLDSRQGRLSYLGAARCVDPHDCLPPAELNVAERDYIKSLSLGSYGPMDLKFTGDRVKLKVKF